MKKQKRSEVKPAVQAAPHYPGPGGWCDSRGQIGELGAGHAVPGDVARGRVAPDGVNHYIEPAAMTHGDDAPAHAALS